MKTGPTVPQNVRQLRSDLPITSLGHTKKGENHMTSKLVHTVSQAPDRTGNAHKHVLNSHYGQNVACLLSVLHNETTRRAILQQSGLLGTTESCIIRHHTFIQWKALRQ